MKSFEWNGQRIPLADDQEDWDIDEIDAAEEWAGCDMSQMRSGKRSVMVIGISVCRAVPGTTFVDVVTGIKPAKVLASLTDHAARKAPADHRPKTKPRNVTRPDTSLTDEPSATPGASDGVVLSPTNADS